MEPSVRSEIGVIPVNSLKINFTDSESEDTSLLLAEEINQRHTMPSPVLTSVDAVAVDLDEGAVDEALLQVHQN